MSRYEELTDIKSRLEIPAYLVAQGLLGQGVEVGVLFGEFSAQTLERWPGILWLVDPWVNQSPKVYLDGSNAVDMEEAYRRTVDAVAQFGARARIVRDYSANVAPTIADGSLDLVYLDGNHAKREVAADIAAWWPKIRGGCGALLAGHDFYERHDAYQDCGVRSAVQEFAGSKGRTIHTTADTSWFIQKP